jgi:RNAse (barnase) inhibitor barstar
MDLSRLTSPAAPWFHLLAAAPDDARDTLRSLERPGMRVTVRFVRGRRSGTTAAFFDELAAALQFPDYFGDNWDATNDCLGDLTWVHADAIVLGLLDGEKLLANDGDDAARKLVSVLKAAAGHRNHSSVEKAARSFHVVMQSRPIDADEVANRWAALGLDLSHVKSANALTPPA